MRICITDDTIEQWSRDCKYNFRNLLEIAWSERSGVGIVQRIERIEREKNINGLG
jgi:hypothetical protein